VSTEENEISFDEGLWYTKSLVRICGDYMSFYRFWFQFWSLHYFWSTGVDYSEYRIL